MINKYFKLSINILGIATLVLIIFLFNMNKIDSNDLLISILGYGSVWCILHEMDIVEEKNEYQTIKK